MPITLAQAKELSQSKLTDIVIDEFQKSNLLNDMEFDNTVKAQGGKTLAYVYNRVTTQPTAGTRAINGEYTAQETVTGQETVNLKVMGGSYEIDRVIQEDETQVVNQVEFQSKQKAKATIAVFHDLFINGDSASDSTQFDGIDKAVTGTTTEIEPDTFIDLSTAAKIKANYETFLYYVRKLIGAMDGTPNKLLMNNDMFVAFQSISDIVSNVKFTRDELGNEIGFYGSTKLEKLGDKAGTSDPIIANTGRNCGTGLGTYTLTTDTDINPVKIYYTRSGNEGAYVYTEVETPVKANIATYYEQDGVYVTGVTDLYAVRLGMDGVHGVSPDGDKLVKTYKPNFKDPGAVKKGEVEMVAAIAVESTRSVGALRNIKVV